MFLLHERTRKSLCKLGFFAVCLLPTCAVALWAASRNGEGHRARCEAELSRLLQSKVTFGGVESPEPRITRYTDFRLADPQTGAPIASAAKIEVHSSDGRVTIVTPRLTITAHRASALAELLHKRLRDRSETGAIPVRLAIDEAIVASENDKFSLRDVGGRIEPSSGGRGAQLTFRTAAMAKDAQPIILALVRYPDARIGFHLDTRGALQEAAGSFRAVLQLLHTLVTDRQVLVPVTREAEAVMQIDH